MASQAFVYTNFRKRLGQKAESLATDTYNLALFSASYTPNRDSDVAYQVNAPGAPTLTQSAGGTQAARTVYYKTTHVNSMGESLPSSEANISVSANNVVTVTTPTNPGASCTGYNVYASTTSGGEQKQNASPIAYGTNWTEPNSGLIVGSAVPSTNTAQISGELPTLNGYIAGGVALAGTGWVLSSANSWADTWSASTTYNVGQLVRPATANGFIYRCVQSGVSGSSVPTWATQLVGLTADGGVWWQCMGGSLVVLTGGGASWTVTDVINYRYAVLYSATTNDLVALFDPGVAQNGPSNGTISIAFDPAGIIAL